MFRLNARQRLNAALRTLRPVLDIVEERVVSADDPVWCRRRGWGSFLRALSDEDLRSCEERGLASTLPELPSAPPDLLELGRALSAATALPGIDARAVSLSDSELRSVRARKREQLRLLLSALGPMATHAERIVDVGAGRGGFTRLAARHFERTALGIDVDVARVAAANAEVSANAEVYHSQELEFRASDVFRDGLDLRQRDLAVGLHACGELGDQLVRTAADVGCDAALISCCLQKIRGSERLPLSVAAEGTVFSRGILGLTNQTSQPFGVEAPLAEMLCARKARYSLFRLLRGRGVELSPGAEMRGINRRRAHSGLFSLAESALALRGLAPPTPAEVAEHECAAELAFPIMRRLDLPRVMLARLVEVSIALDRASHFEERGFHSEVLELFDSAVTPRNLAIFASRDAERLPHPTER